MQADENRKIAAIFDLDGTMFTGHFWQGIINHHFKYGLKIPQVFRYLGTHYPLWMGAKLKLLSEGAMKIKWGEDMALLLRGLSSEEIRGVFTWVDENYFAPRLRANMVTLLRQHKEMGHTTFVLSGSFQGFLEIINRRLAADYVVGTGLEMKNGFCSGRIEKPFCFGKAKVDLLRRRIERMNLDIDFPSSFAYADSLTDLPVLQMVGIPVACYPDPGLLKLAMENNWQVIQDGTN